MSEREVDGSRHQYQQWHHLIGLLEGRRRASGGDGHRVGNSSVSHCAGSSRCGECEDGSGEHEAGAAGELRHHSFSLLLHAAALFRSHCHLSSFTSICLLYTQLSPAHCYLSISAACLLLSAIAVASGGVRRVCSVGLRGQASNRSASYRVGLTALKTAEALIVCWAQRCTSQVIAAVV